MSKNRIRNYTYQLPACITNGVYNNFSLGSLKGFIIYTVFIRSCFYTVFSGNPVTNLNLPWMINNIAVTVAQIIVLSVSNFINLVHHPGYTGKVHINQQHSHLRISVFRKFYHAAGGNHPVISEGTVLEKILNMRCRKMNIFHLFHSALIPFLSGHIRIFLLGSHWLRCHEAAITVINSNGTEFIPVSLIQQIHALLNFFSGIMKVIFFYYIVINCVGNLSHIYQIVLHSLPCLFHQFPGVLNGFLS